MSWLWPSSEVRAELSRAGVSTRAQRLFQEWLNEDKEQLVVLHGLRFWVVEMGCGGLRWVVVGWGGWGWFVSNPSWSRSEMIECSIQHFHAHYISHEDGRGFFAQIHMAYGNFIAEILSCQ